MIFYYNNNELFPLLINKLLRGDAQKEPCNVFGIQQLLGEFFAKLRKTGRKDLLIQKPFNVLLDLPFDFFIQIEKGERLVLYQIRGAVSFVCKVSCQEILKEFLSAYVSCIVKVKDILI